MSRATLRSQWRLKVTLSLCLPVVFCVPYFGLQRLVFFPVHRFEPGWLDRHIPFDPDWVYVYQSLYLLMPILPWLAVRREHLLRYTRGFLMLAGIAFVCFLLFPVAGPRPSEAPTTGLYGLLLRYDRELNAFPSLHVGLTVYHLLFGLRILSLRWSRAAVYALMLPCALWGLAIAWSTVATRQHYAIDVLAGAALAWACHHRAWSRADCAPEGGSPCGNPAPASAPSQPCC